MDENQTSYCVVLDTTSQAKLICYTRRKNEIFSICLTDSTDVWSTEITEDRIKHASRRFALISTKDYIQNLRSACSSGDVSVAVHDSTAELLVGSSPGNLSITLSRLEGPEATEELKELLFRMADSLTHLDGTSPSVSPGKNYPKCPAEFQPRQQNCAPSVTVKRRLPGASLINPGTKRKLQATGVAFEDVDEN